MLSKKHSVKCRRKCKCKERENDRLAGTGQRSVWFFLKERSHCFISFQFLLLIGLLGTRVANRGCNGLQQHQAIGFLLNSSAVLTQPSKVTQYPEYEGHSHGSELRYRRSSSSILVSHNPLSPLALPKNIFFKHLCNQFPIINKDETFK